jgi:citrate synthase
MTLISLEWYRLVISTFFDHRGQELMYSGVPISEVLGSYLGLGGVIFLWFKRMLPKFATGDFIEMILMLTTDHSPAVSGTMNTIVSSRAGNDFVSSLCSGLLTISSRFDDALDEARDKGHTPREVVDNARKANKLITGTGHRITSGLWRVHVRGDGQYIKIGMLNGLFVFGRSIGFIDHHLDQKRFKAPLYRHPADNIFINMADVNVPRVLGKMQ